VALHRNPRAARGDAHRLVVISVGTTAGEGIVEPEIAGLSDPVGDVRESRSALVRGDHEIGVFAVKHLNGIRVHHLAADDIVGDRQQRADKNLVRCAALCGPGFTIKRG